MKENNSERKLILDPEKNSTESRKKIEHSEEKETIIKELRVEIEKLKKKVADQEETIDYLVQERDEESDQVYKLKLKLADAWNVTFSDDADKVREVARLVRLNERPKSYCDATKGLNTNEAKRSNAIATDSGIDMQSLEKLIDKRVAVTMDAKLEKHIKNNTGAINRNSSNEFTQMVYTNKAELDDPNITPTTIDDT